MNASKSSAQRLYRDHTRRFEGNRFVYPVLSRRSGGISIGVNLNPDKVCNFDCIYCQVDRVRQSETRFVDVDALLGELDRMLPWVASGEIYNHEKFAATPAERRRLNDVAFSGDGEPTTYRNFDELMNRCAEVKRRHGLDGVKMILITNASMFHRPHVRRGLQCLMRNNGEIWAKLDAGSEAYYRRIERTSIPFQQVLENLAWAACRWPLVIQSLFMRVQDSPPTDDEIEAFGKRLSEIIAAGGRIKRVQVYTVARPAAESYVTPLSNAEVDRIADRVHRQTNQPTQAFYGSSTV